MDLISIDVNEESGRNGEIEFEDGKIKTPYYIPTKGDLNSLRSSPFVEDKYLNRIDTGEIVCWLDDEQLTKFVHMDKYYEGKKYDLSNDFVSMDTTINILHFSFYKDVETLRYDIFELLLELQSDVNTSVIEIPNFNGNWDYAMAIQKALEWKRSKEIDKPLMAVASKLNDIEIIKSQISNLDAIGINLTPFSKPLLVEVKHKLKDQEKWIHGISAPPLYSNRENQGSLGMLINYYGIDTISNPVMNWKGVRGFMEGHSQKTEDQRIEEMAKKRYFVPVDYGTPQIQELQSNYGSEINLSDFCDCPVCSSRQLKDIILDPDITHHTVRSHQILSFQREANNFREKLNDNEAQEYINSKIFANKIISGA